MKTLPDAIIAGMDGDSGRVILVRIIPGSGDTWGDLLWATRDITILDWESGGSSKSFAGNMLAEGKLGTIKQSVDIEQGGNVAKVSGLTLQILNPEYNGTDRFDQSFVGNLENREVEIRLAFWTGSNPAWSDTLLLYKGVVEDMDYDYGIYKIKVQDAGFKRHKDIPDLIIDKDTYPEAPEENIGKTIPLLYGTVSGGVFQLGTAFYPPAICINKNKYIFAVSRNKAGMIHTEYQEVYCDDADCFAALIKAGAGASFTTNKARPSTFQFSLSSRYDTQHATQLGRQGDKTLPTTLDYRNAVDTDASSYFTLGASQELWLYSKWFDSRGGKQSSFGC